MKVANSSLLGIVLLAGCGTSNDAHQQVVVDDPPTASNINMVTVNYGDRHASTVVFETLVKLDILDATVLSNGVQYVLDRPMRADELVVALGAFADFDVTVYRGKTIRVRSSDQNP